LFTIAFDWDVHSTSGAQLLSPVPVIVHERYSLSFRGHNARVCTLTDDLFGNTLIGPRHRLAWSFGGSWGDISVSRLCQLQLRARGMYLVLELHGRHGQGTRGSLLFLQLELFQLLGKEFSRHRTHGCPRQLHVAQIPKKKVLNGISWRLFNQELKKCKSPEQKMQKMHFLAVAVHALPTSVATHF
jgi:hypothetical protein